MHPAHLVTPEIAALRPLWEAWRGRRLVQHLPAGPRLLSLPMGRTPPLLPFAGSLADQPACTVAAFEWMDATADRVEREGYQRDGEE